MKSRMSFKMYKPMAIKVDLSSLKFQKLKIRILSKLNFSLQCFTLFQISLRKILNKLRSKELMKNKILKFHHSCQTTVKFSYQITTHKIIMKPLSPTSNNWANLPVKVDMEVLDILMLLYLRKVFQLWHGHPKWPQS